METNFPSVSRCWQWLRFGLLVTAGAGLCPMVLAINPGDTVSLGSASGGPSESQRTFSFPAASGTLLISYNMYSVPDSLSVSANGVQLTSTVGRVQGSSTLRVPVSGVTSAVIIVNAGNGLDGTVWDYSVSFTVAPAIPEISGIGGAAAGQTLDLNGGRTGMWGDPVHTGTGAQVMEWTVLRVNGARDLSLTVGYNSLFTAFGQIGRGWHHSFEARLLLLPGGGIQFLPHPAEMHSFQAQPDGTFVSYDLATRQTTLVRESDGRHVFTYHDQRKLVFDATGNLARLIDAQGRELLVTRAGGRVDRVTEPVSGLYLSFEYNSQGFVSRVADTSGRAVRFGYDAGLEGKLISLSLPHVGSPSSPPSWQFTYTADAQLQKATDPDGRVSFINYYDEKGRIASQDDGRTDNEMTQFIYDEQSFPGRLTTTVIDRNRSTVRFTYDSEYRMEAVMDENGVATQYTYDALSQELALIEAPQSHLFRLQYDSRGNVTKLTLPDGAATAFTHDTRNNLTSMTNAVGQKVQMAYDGYNLPSLVTLPDTTTVSVQTAAGGLPGAIAFPTGATSRMTYQQGRMTQFTDPSGVVTQYSYDTLGRPSAIINGLGGSTTFAYDANDNIVSVSTPLRRVTTLAYSGQRALLSQTDPSGSVRRYAYDGNKNLVESTDPLGAKTRFEYDSEDRLIAVTDPSGGRAFRTLDRTGATTSVSNALGHVTRFTYDTLGRVSRITDALGQNVAQYTYDLRDRPLSETDALGRNRSYAWDALSRLTRITDELGRVTQYAYDSRSRLTSVTNAAGETIRQLFDADNQVVAVADAKGNLVDYEFDAAGRTKKVTTQEGRSSSLSYDSAGQPVSIIRPSGVATVLTYDADGRVTRVSDPMGNTDLSYDPAGHVTGFREGITTLVSHTFDAAGRRTSSRDNLGATVNYGWDAGGRLAQLTYPSGHTVAYTYDLAGRLATVTDWSSRVTRYSWDANGRLTKVERPNGTSQTRAYNAKGLMSALRELGVGGVVIVEWTYSYDAAGQLIEETRSPAATVPLPPSVRMTFDADNRLASYNGQAVVCDADGNLRRGPLGGGAFGDYTINARNQLTGAANLTYGYDLQNLRTSVTAGAVSTRFSFDLTGPTPRVLTAKKDTTTTEYVYGVGLLYEETGTQTRYYHYDYRGSTVALSDGSGAVKGTALYGPWGEDAGTTGEVPEWFRFHGQWGAQTDSNGLVLMGARYYHPGMRRFVSPDPIGLAGGMNSYAFVENNPISFVDPSGLWVGVDDAIFSAGGALVGVLGQAAGDAITSIANGKLQVSGWEDYAGSAVGGAAGGEAILYTGPLGAAVIGGAAGNAAKQGLKNLSGKQAGFDFKSFGFETVVGGLTGLIPGSKKLLDYQQLWKSTLEGLKNGTIKSLTTRNGLKIFVGSAAESALVPGTLAATTSGFVTNITGLVPASEESKPPLVPILITFKPGTGALPPILPSGVK
ncbi:MAG: RHS repeat-associated core domain-containing protein [Opitutaceae bacterium]